MTDPDRIVDFLVGQVMKATRGKANPALTRQLIVERLEAALTNEQQKTEGTCDEQVFSQG